MHEIHKGRNIYLYIRMENKEKWISKVMQNYDFNYTLTKSSAKKNPERINYADVG